MATFLWDLICCLIPVTLSVIIFAAFQVTGYTGEGLAGVAMLLVSCVNRATGGRGWLAVCAKHGSCLAATAHLPGGSASHYGDHTSSIVDVYDLWMNTHDQKWSMAVEINSLHLVHPAPVVHLLGHHSPCLLNVLSLQEQPGGLRHHHPPPLLQCHSKTTRVSVLATPIPPSSRYLRSYTLCSNPLATPMQPIHSITSSF